MKNLYYIKETDTYGGEAKYSWVKTIVFEAPENARISTLVRLAKEAMGWTGQYSTYDDGCTIRLDLCEEDVCAFVEKLDEAYSRHRAILEDWKKSTS